MGQPVKRVTLAAEAYQDLRGKTDKLALLGSWDLQGLLDPQGPQALDVQWDLDLRIPKGLEASGCCMNPGSLDQRFQVVPKEKKETRGPRVTEGWMEPALWDPLGPGGRQGTSRSCPVLWLTSPTGS